MRFPLAAGAILGVALGVAAGIGGYTFIYAKGASYLTSDPGTCGARMEWGEGACGARMEWGVGSGE